MLIFNSVDKSYGKDKANTNINIEFESGKVYGVLGKDCSGKSTLMKLAAGQIKPSNGIVTLDDERVYENSKVIEKISLVREDGIGIDDFKVAKMFDMASFSYKNWDEEFKDLLVGEFELDTSQRYYKLSSEEKNIVGIILGLASRAEWTLFDESTSNLSKVNILKFCEILRKDLANNPRTVVMTNSQVDESSELFDSVILLKDGNVVLEESMESIKSKLFYISGENTKMEEIETYKNMIFKANFGDTVVLGIFDELSETQINHYKGKGLSLSAMPFERGYKYFTEYSIEEKVELDMEVELKMDYEPKAVEEVSEITDEEIEEIDKIAEVVSEEKVIIKETTEDKPLENLVSKEKVILKRPEAEIVEDKDIDKTDRIIVSEVKEEVTIENDKEKIIKVTEKDNIIKGGNEDGKSE